MRLIVKAGVLRHIPNPGSVAAAFANARKGPSRFADDSLKRDGTLPTFRH